ncbi:MAG: DUF86 domain-containing protein [Planctomycetes bacterium]|nr:DUF86 domain-containing protein [Planctomycetota bacterium]
MVDKALILRKLSEIDQYIKQLEEFANISLEKYSNDWKTQRIVERTLQILIETCTDIANHIISDKEYRVPKSYAETFEVLYENNIISKELFNIMSKMARFRNIVVHHYDTIDAAIVISILRKNLKDFTIFQDAIIKILK